MLLYITTPPEIMSDFSKLLRVAIMSRSDNVNAAVGFQPTVLSAKAQGVA